MFFAGAGYFSQSYYSFLGFLTWSLFIFSLACCPFIWLRISKLPHLVNSQCSTKQDYGSPNLCDVSFSSSMSTIYLSFSPEYPRSCWSYLQQRDFWWLFVSSSCKKSYEFNYFSALEKLPRYYPKGFSLLHCSLTFSIMSNHPPLLPASK